MPDLRRVTVVEYDPNWPRRFRVAADEIQTALGDTILEIHHIGSTSVPGLAAKPVIDLLAVYEDAGLLDGRRQQMEQVGYEVMGEYGIAGRRFFWRDDAAGNRTHHLHAFPQGSHDVRRHLAFRDYLRQHPPVAAAYARLKIDLARRYPADIHSYMDGKDSFVKETEAKAVAWQDGLEIRNG